MVNQDCGFFPAKKVKIFKVFKIAKTPQMEIHTHTHTQYDFNNTGLVCLMASAENFIIYLLNNVNTNTLLIAEVKRKEVKNLFVLY